MFVSFEFVAIAKNIALVSHKMKLFI